MNYKQPWIGMSFMNARFFGVEKLRIYSQKIFGVNPSRKEVCLCGKHGIKKESMAHLIKYT